MYTYSLNDIGAALDLTYRQVWYRLHHFNLPYEKRGKTIYADPADFMCLSVGATRMGIRRKTAQRGGSAPSPATESSALWTPSLFHF